ncbi:MAG: hypothetical protein Phog2KO_42760 [Phototrophicaceae bacterium]
MSSGLMTLIAYIVVLVPLMLLGFYFARRKMFDPHHKITMTLVVILNWILIGAVMAGSYINGVAPNLPDGLSEGATLIPTIHAIVGLTAQLMATYLALLMWTENTALEGLIPFRIKNIKTPMRVTLSLWLITVALGFGLYAVWYGGTESGDDAPQPAVTESVDDLGADEPATTEEADTGEEEVPELDATEEVEDESGEDSPELDATEEAEDEGEEEVPAPDATEDS